MWQIYPDWASWNDVTLRYIFTKGTAANEEDGFETTITKCKWQGTPCYEKLNLRSTPSVLPLVLDMKRAFLVETQTQIWNWHQEGWENPATSRVFMQNGKYPAAALVPTSRASGKQLWRYHMRANKLPLPQIDGLMPRCSQHHNNRGATVSISIALLHD